MEQTSSTSNTTIAISKRPPITPAAIIGPFDFAGARVVMSEPGIGVVVVVVVVIVKVFVVVFVVGLVVVVAFVAVVEVRRVAGTLRVSAVQVSVGS